MTDHQNNEIKNDRSDRRNRYFYNNTSWTLQYPFILIERRTRQKTSNETGFKQPNRVTRSNGHIGHYRTIMAYTFFSSAFKELISILKFLHKKTEEEGTLLISFERPALP